jgi:hypothetical protein
LFAKRIFSRKFQIFEKIFPKVNIFINILTKILGTTNIYSKMSVFEKKKEKKKTFREEKFREISAISLSFYFLRKSKQSFPDFVSIP